MSRADSGQPERICFGLIARVEQGYLWVAHSDGTQIGMPDTAARALRDKLIACFPIEPQSA